MRLKGGCKLLFIVMAKINSFEELEIWQKARELCQYVELLIQTTSLKTNYSL
jgi:hypothetical protein